MKRGAVNVIFLIIAIIIILYVLWFIVIHSVPTTLTDLISVWGSTLAVFILVVVTAIGYVKDKIEDVNDAVNKRMDKFESKVDELVKNFNYLKGRLNEKNSRKS